MIFWENHWCYYLKTWVKVNPYLLYDLLIALYSVSKSLKGMVTQKCPVQVSDPKLPSHVI